MFYYNDGFDLKTLLGRNSSDIYFEIVEYMFMNL